MLIAYRVEHRDGRKGVIAAYSTDSRKVIVRFDDGSLEHVFIRDMMVK